MKGRLKDLAKRTIVVLVAMLMVVTGMFTGGAQEVRAETANASHNPNSPHGSYLYYFNVGNTVAYCGEQHKGDTMNNVAYNVSATNATDYENVSSQDTYWNYPDKYWRDGKNHWDTIKRILYVGYPNDAAGYGKGVSEDDFREATQEAVWYFTDTQNPYYQSDLANKLINDTTEVPEKVVLKFWSTDVYNNPSFQSLFTLEVPDTPDTQPPTIKSTQANGNGKNAEEGKAAEVTIKKGEKVKIKDTIYFENLANGVEYTVEAAVWSDGSQVSETVTKPVKDVEKIEVEFQDISVEVDEKTFNVKTVLKSNDGTTVHSEHNKGGKDVSERVIVIVEETSSGPMITNTTLKDKNGNGGKIEYTGEEIELIDTISLSGLTPSKSYKVDSTLYYREKATDEWSNKGTQNMTITPDKADITQPATFKVKEKGFYTIKTELYDDEETFDCVTHNSNLNDSNETIEVTEPGTPPGEDDKKHEVEISKVDATTGAELPGAQLTITDKDGKTVASWTSEATPHKVKLEPGTYTLTETMAPENFKKAESIKFTVDENGLVGSDKVVMEDKPVEKKDPTPATSTFQATKKLTGRDLKSEEFTFKLKGVSENAKGHEATAKNDAEGKIKFSGFTYTEPGTYEYEVSEDKGNDSDVTYDTNVKKVTVTVTLDEENNRLLASGNPATTYNAGEFTNTYTPPTTPPTEPEPETVEVTISKTDAATSEELPGAKLTITDKDGKTVATWTSETTPHKVKLEPGTYTLTETTAPDGYEVAESITFEVTKDGVAGGKIEMKDQPTKPEEPENPDNPTPENPDNPDNPTPENPDKPDQPTPTVEKTYVTVTKSWDDEGNAEGHRPASVTVELLANGVATGQTITLDNSSQWVGIFRDLPAKDENGNAIAYTVSETQVPYYVPFVSGNATDGYRITNYNRPWVPMIPGTPGEVGRFTLKKTVSGLASKDRLYEFEVKMTEKDGTVYTTKVSLKPTDEAYAFEYILPGTKVEVTELTTGYTATYTVNGTKGQAFTVQAGDDIKVVVDNYSDDAWPPNTPGKTPGKGVPKTGDEGNALAWLAIMALAGMMGAAAAKKNRG